MNSAKRILLVCNSARSAWGFRRNIISHLASQQHEVHVACPDDCPHAITCLRQLSAHIHIVPFCSGYHLFTNIALLYRLRKLIKAYRFDIVHGFGFKSALASLISTYGHDVPQKVCLISGVGYIFQDINENSTPKKIARMLIVYMARPLFRKATSMWFQNADDADLFLKKRLVTEGQMHIFPGSGIDLPPLKTLHDHRIAKKTYTVLMVGRPLVSKGILEFLKAAQHFFDERSSIVDQNSDAKPWRFVLVAPYNQQSHHYDLVPQKTLQHLAQLAGVELHDTYISCLDDFFAQSDIVALPALAREGTPKVLLEALSYGKAIITTDVPGCRHVVQHEGNGLLCKAGDTKGLIAALERLMNDRPQRHRMSIQARADAEQYTSERLLKSLTNTAYKLR